MTQQRNELRLTLDLSGEGTRQEDCLPLPSSLPEDVAGSLSRIGYTSAHLQVLPGGLGITFGIDEVDVILLLASEIPALVCGELSVTGIGLCGASALLTFQRSQREHTIDCSVTFHDFTGTRIVQRSVHEGLLLRASRSLVNTIAQALADR